MTDHGIRLNKFISDSGFCSRREADNSIALGQVTVNGRAADLGTRVAADDHVKVRGKLIINRSKTVYLAYHKPVGVTCTTDSQDPSNIVKAVHFDQRIFPIGRLDKDSEGLIFLTNDGDIVNKILRAGNAHDKEYLVSVDKPLGSDFATRMSGGLPILGQMTLPCQVTLTGGNTFKIVLQQGLNRQIRRMCEHLGYQVTRLKRTRIMHISLGSLKLGQWRHFNAQELQLMLDAIAESDNQHLPVASGDKPLFSGPKKSQHPAAKYASAKAPEQGKNQSHGQPSPRHKPKPPSGSGYKGKAQNRTPDTKKGRASGR